MTVTATVASLRDKERPRRCWALRGSCCLPCRSICGIDSARTYPRPSSPGEMMHSATSGVLDTPLQLRHLHSMWRCLCRLMRMLGLPHRGQTPSRSWCSPPLGIGTLLPHCWASIQASKKALACSSALARIRAPSIPQRRFRRGAPIGAWTGTVPGTAGPTRPRPPPD